MSKQITEFYIWLASNASTNTYPDNKPQSFKNKLAESLNFEDGNWEVALAEIFYPNNYHLSIESGLDFDISYYLKEGIEVVHHVASPQLTFYSLKDCITKFNDIVRQATQSGAGISSSGGPIILELIGSSNQRLVLRSDLSTDVTISVARLTSYDFFSRLGFTQFTPPTQQRIKRIKHNVTFRTALEANLLAYNISDHPALFVYCDKVEYQFVGDTRTPLLLALPVYAPESKPLVWESYNRLTYVPLKKGYINDIEIIICFDSGEPVIFKEGKVFIKLHFQKNSKLN